MSQFATGDTACRVLATVDAPGDECVVLFLCGFAAGSKVAVGQDFDEFGIRKRPTEATLLVTVTVDVGLESHGEKLQPISISG